MKKILYPTVLLSFSYLIYWFYSQKEESMGIEVNPFSVVYFFGVWFPTCFIFGLLFTQTQVIIQGITNKQAHSIRQFQSKFIDGRMIEDPSVEYKEVRNKFHPSSSNLSFSSSIKNLILFCCRGTGKSLVFESLKEFK